MEDDEEISSSKVINQYSFPDAEVSKLSGTEELTNTEQCDYVPELYDSKLVGAESPIVEKNDEAVVAEDTEMVTETVAAISGGGNSVTELLDLRLVDSEPLLAAKDDNGGEAVVEGEIPMVDTEIETEPEAKAVEAGGGEHLPELHDSQLLVAHSLIAAKDDEDDEAAVGEEILAWDTKMEMETEAEAEAETARNGVGEYVPELHDSRLVGAHPLIAAKDDEDDEAAVGEEILAGDTRMEVEAETARNGVGEHVPELNDSQLVGAELLIASKDDEEDEAAVETEADAANGGGVESVLEINNSQFVDAESPIAAEDEEDEAMLAEEEAEAEVEIEMETEMDVAESVKVGGGKRKRGKNSKVPVLSPKVSVRAPARKAIEEDVCFICFDGGDLVLCDRRGCPKAYHPSCVNRDEAFFRAKGRWNCGWHLCSNCEKNAYYMCFTCTFSLCKGCIKDAVILCVRGNKGFCETCMKTVMLIETNEHGNKEAQVDFDDKSSWEYLFKDYWIDLKARLSLSSIELAEAKNPWKGSDVPTGKQESPDEHFNVNDDGRSGSDNSSENIEASKSKRRKAKKRSKSLSKEEDLTSAAVAVGAEGTSTHGSTEWASKELLEFVMHMKNGDRSILSQFDVQALLLEYIKRNKLRDPRRKSQIVCDARLENLFGKARVGHFEMLKLLESHFFIKEDSQTDDVQGSVVDTEVNHVEAEALTKGGKDRKRKTRKKGDRRGSQSNLDDYAAIDIHNINLIYLRRKLAEDLLEDIEMFRVKVVGTFVRIRISGSNQKQDIYRLVQVVGTGKGADPYKLGKRTTDIMLEILNLNKTEVISIDTISNQEFTEDECKRLRQSIKCGLINRLTVGDILDKAMEVQAARVNDWLETEVVRLSHLRDRASEKGRRKELRECVEKLQLLKTPEERRRRLEEIPEIHADPNMDPSHESEDDDSEMDDNKREGYLRSRGSGRRQREPMSPGRGDFPSKDSWSGTRKNSSKNWESNRNLSDKNLSNKVEDSTLSFEIRNENPWNQGRDKDTQQSNTLEKPSSASNSETVGWNSLSIVRSESFPGVTPETSLASLSAPVAETAAKISETEKMWHYLDPSGKVQGPFSVVQLRKWSNTGYFPVDLRIWRSTGKKDDSILLTDALAGRFQQELSPSNLSPSGQSSGGNRISQPDLSSSRGWTTPSVEVPTDRVGSDYVSRNDSVNLPSPTPKQSTTGWTGGEVGPLIGASSYPGGNGALQSPAAATPDSGQLSRLSTSSSVNPSGSKELNAMGSLGILAPMSLLNPGGQLTRVSENDSMGSHPSFSGAPNSEQGVLVSRTDSLQTYQSTATGESYGVQTHGHLPPAPDTAAQMIKSANSQNPPVGTHGWASAPSQTLEPNSSVHVPGQASAYSHWVGVPSAVQNPVGNFSTQGVLALPPPDPWRPPIPGNQSNMQLPAPPNNVPWSMGIAENNTTAHSLRPDNPNTGWGTMSGNPNMAWGGPAPGNTNINWVATVQVPSPGNANPVWVVPTGNSGGTVQGPVPGNLNPCWVAPTGNPGATVQGLAPGNANQGWVAPTGNPGAAIVQGLAPGNANQGWVASTGNPGATVQGPVPGNGNPGWVAPPGNPGATVQGPAPGNANQSWGSPARSQGRRGSEHHHNGDRFSGQRDRGSQGGDSGFGGGRPWNRQSSFGSGGSGGSSRSVPTWDKVCKYHEGGHCKKGSSCNFLHP